MAVAVTTDILRELAAFEAENGCALSIYVDFDPSSTPTTPDVETKFNAVLSEAEKLSEGHAGDRDCKLALRDDIQRIRAWWDGFGASARDETLVLVDPADAERDADGAEIVTACASSVLRFRSAGARVTDIVTLIDAAS